jgi:hypothetical protein
MARATTEALWRGRIAAQARSGLSALAYCGQQGFSPKSFYAWRRRLAENESDRSAPLFVPLELPAAALHTGGLRIELPGGAALVLPADASEERLACVLRAVVEVTGEQSAC